MCSFFCVFWSILLTVMEVTLHETFRGLHSHEASDGDPESEDQGQKYQHSCQLIGGHVVHLKCLLWWVPYYQCHRPIVSHHSSTRWLREFYPSRVSRWMPPSWREGPQSYPLILLPWPCRRGWSQSTWCWGSWSDWPPHPIDDIIHTGIPFPAKHG